MGSILNQIFANEEDQTTFKESVESFGSRLSKLKDLSALMKQGIFRFSELHGQKLYDENMGALEDIDAVLNEVGNFIGDFEAGYLDLEIEALESLLTEMETKIEASRNLYKYILIYNEKICQEVYDLISGKPRKT